MEGWGWQSVHDPAVLPQVLERWQQSLASGEPFDMVFPLKGTDGHFRPFLTRINPLFGEGGQVLYWFGTNTDIHELRQARAALTDSEERLRLALDAGRMGVWDWNVRTGDLKWSDSLEPLARPRPRYIRRHVRPLPATHPPGRSGLGERRHPAGAGDGRRVLRRVPQRLAERRHPLDRRFGKGVSRRRRAAAPHDRHRPGRDPAEAGRANGPLPRRRQRRPRRAGGLRQHASEGVVSRRAVLCGLGDRRSGRGGRLLAAGVRVPHRPGQGATRPRGSPPLPARSQLRRKASGTSSARAGRRSSRRLPTNFSCSPSTTTNCSASCGSLG